MELPFITPPNVNFSHQEMTFSAFADTTFGEHVALRFPCLCQVGKIWKTDLCSFSVKFMTLELNFEILMPFRNKFPFKSNVAQFEISIASLQTGKMKFFTTPFLETDCLELFFFSPKSN